MVALAWEKAVSRNPKILLVEDNPSVARSLAHLLAGSGYDVVTAHDGAEGLNLARTEAIDLILLDWMLPDIEGPEFLRDARDYTQSPCIMVTAQDGPEHAVQALEAGCDDYIEKPIRPDELLLRVERVLQRSAEDAGD